jgi:hypothetical protein
MMRLAVPSFLFAILAGVSLAVSGAPARVHLLDLVALAAAFWAPAVTAGNIDGLRRRWPICLLLILSGCTLGDATKSLVIAKAGMLDILTGAPWVYGVGILVFGFLILVSAGLSTTWTKHGHVLGN